MKDDSPPMRVLMLGKGWFPDELGGLDRFFRALHAELRRHGAEAEGVVVGPASSPAAGIRVVGRHNQSLVRRLLGFHAAARANSEDPDVVDAHFALYAAGPALLSRLRRRPLAVHFQGPWADESVAAGDHSRLRWQLRFRLERALYRRASLVIVLSRAFQRTVIDSYGVLPWDVRVIPPGVDIDRFTPGDRWIGRRRWGVAGDAFLLVAVRRLVPRMGLDVLLDALAEVRRNSSADVMLLIAGEGPGRAELERQASKRNLEDAVCFLGRITDEEVLDLYRAADLNVVPSVAHEGFGLVVLEAAACGTPSLVTSVGGLPEAAALIDGCLVVPPGESSALSRLIGRLVTDRSQLPKRAMIRARAELYSWDEAAARTLAAFREISHAVERPMRIVYLDHVARLSGGELALLRLLPALKEVRAHVVLAEEGPLVDRLRAAGISVEVVPMPVAARELRKDAVAVDLGAIRAFLYTISYAIRLARRLRRLKPDLVHANSLKSGVYGAIACKLVRVPFIWHVRDRIETDYLTARGVALIRWMTSKGADAVIVNSNATRQSLHPVVDSHVVYSVVPEVIDRPRQEQEPPPNDRLQVGMVGRLAPWKGQHVFLEAFADAFPDSDAGAAVLIGSAMFGEGAYERRLADLCSELGLAGRVDMRGFRENIWHELACLDILVHASVTPEPFGQVVLEGMAAGLPVIATNGGGPAEFVEDGVTGLLVPPGDPAALATALRRLAEDPELRRRLGMNGREKAKEFAPERVARDVMRVYRSVPRVKS